ncbi:MAG: peptidyl-prolyl cis-trans isomerase, partial [Luteolibacter sp.]
KPVTAEPTDAELDATRSELPRESTTLPQQISFDHVSYSGTDKVPADILTKLRGGADPKSLGEPMQLANPLPPTYRPQVERLLGNDFAEKIFVQPLNEWLGPISSSRGVFFIRVIARQSEQPLALEAIKPILESHWMNQRQGDAVAREVDRLKENYRVVMPQPNSNTGGVE